MAIVSVLALSVMALPVLASDDAQLSQVINAGTLVADIRDNNLATVANPAFSMSAAAFSFTCQAGGSASTGTIGSNTQRLYVDNPGQANNGWTLTMAATNGVTDLWHNSGSTKQFDFNDPTGGTAGCTDGADVDNKAGQMTLTPTAGTLTADCAACVTTNITKGSATAFNQGTTDTITLLNAAASSDDIGRWYLTGVGVSQTIPAEQPNDSYTVDMTITATAS